MQSSPDRLRGMRPGGSSKRLHLTLTPPHTNSTRLITACWPAERCPRDRIFAQDLSISPWTKDLCPPSSIPRPPCHRVWCCANHAGLCLGGCVVTDMASLQGSGDGTVAEGLFVKRGIPWRASQALFSPKLDRPGLVRVARVQLRCDKYSRVVCELPSAASVHSHAPGPSQRTPAEARVAIASIRGTATQRP